MCSERISLNSGHEVELLNVFIFDPDIPLIFEEMYDLQKHFYIMIS